MSGIHIYGTKTDANVTELCSNVKWSGSVKSCARTLSFTLAGGEGAPAVPSALGDNVQMWDGTKKLFDGFIRKRQVDGEDGSIALTCYDRGFALNKNSIFLPVAGQTAESVTAQLCGQFGIPMGEIAQTGVKLTRNFMGVTLYKIIATLYTLASASTGVKYQVRFSGEKLTVIRKEAGAETLLIRPGSNLWGAKATQSVENMVNAVAVYDDNFGLLYTQKAEEAIKTHGLMQDAIKKSAYDDAGAEAARRLEDGGEERTVTAECVGNPALIAGNTCVLQDGATGLFGLFWIDSDSHSLENGLWTVQLTLNFRNVMDEATAGSLPTA